MKTYGLKNLSFEPQYILPKIINSRLLGRVSSAVAKAAIEEGFRVEKTNLSILEGESLII